MQQYKCAMTKCQNEGRFMMTKRGDQYGMRGILRVCGDHVELASGKDWVVV